MENLLTNNKYTGTQYILYCKSFAEKAKNDFKAMLQSNRPGNSML